MDHKNSKFLKRNASTPQKTSLSASELLRHAEAVIRFDKASALNSQQGLQDLVSTASDGSRNPSVIPKALSSLDQLTSNRGNVKIQDHDKSEVGNPPKNIVSFGQKKKD